MALGKNSKSKLVAVIIILFLSPLFSFSHGVEQITYCSCGAWPNWNEHVDVKCGYLTVPEDHSNATGKSIRIAFAIFKSKSVNPESVPVIILTGGPGVRSLTSLDRWTNHESRAVGDLIVVEQRGIGLSSALPDLSDKLTDILASNTSSEEEIEMTKKIIQEHLTKVAAEGIDLSKYNTTQNAKDIGMLMDALGYPRYNLLGTSYGTKLGMMVMKYFSPKIKACILDGPAVLNNTALESRFPDLKRAFNKLYERCEADASCKKNHPDLKGEILQAIQSLKKSPITIQLLNGEFSINPQDAVYFIRYLLYREDAFVTVPSYVKAIIDRDMDAVRILSESPSRMLGSANASAFFSFNAYEEFSEDTPTKVKAYMNSTPELAEGIAWFQGFIPMLSEWHQARVPANENKLESIATPTLIITNELDPVTPPHNTIQFEKALTNEHVLKLNIFGHGSGGSCIASIRTAFFINPENAINTQCLE